MKYDKENNDTYTEMYSQSMIGDIEIHMFKDLGTTTKHGINGRVFMGGFSSESIEIAKNKVLHFSNTNKNLKLLKYKNINTLVPKSLIKRYSIELDNCTFIQKTPIFYNIENDKFVLKLDERFIRDLTNEEIDVFKSNIKNLIDNGSVNFDNELYINYESIDSLSSDSSNIFKSIKIAYEKTIIKDYKTEDVIIVVSDLQENQKPYLKELKEKPIDYNSSSLSFEFFKAKKIGKNKFYLYNKNNDLIHKIVYFKNIKEEEKISSSSIFTEEKYDTLVLKHTEQNWNILISLKDESNQIFKELNKILNLQKTNEKYDNSITNIVMPILKIENKKNMRLS